MDANGMSVAVVGTGPAGLAAMKSLLDEGFQITAFDRRHAPGGIWAFTDDPTITSVTTATKTQLSKFQLPFSDLPISDDTQCHMPGTELGDYYAVYARHYGLLERITFNTTVEAITRDSASDKWCLHLHDKKKPLVFDKVVYAVGTENTAKYPSIGNLDAFKGVFMHGQAYKRPEQFKGMNVLIIGQGNTGADCAVEIASAASNVYISRRRGSVVVPRVVAGKRFDGVISWKIARIGFWLTSYLPTVNKWLMTATMGSAMEKAWGSNLDPALGFEPRPEYASNISATLINENLVPATLSGSIKPTTGVRRIVGPKSVEMDDGSVIDDIDAIVACTGYCTPFEPLGESISFTEVHPKVPSQPNLYQNIFSLDHPTSLACLNYIVIYDNAATAREVAAMAVAQVFAGKSTLPPRPVMERQVRSRQAWFADKYMSDPLPQLEGLVQPDEWSRFVHTTAGTGLYENLGWTLRGLWFFFTSPLLYFTMAWGVNTPHLFRYFETGKRKAWSGAKEAILHANELSKADLAIVKT